MRQRAKGEYVTNSSVFEESCNVFVPWYRQVGMKYGGEVTKKYGSIEAAFDAEPYTDIKAALDYFFEKCNNGRPFIIAGHSQGSAMVKYVLKNYFKEHPDYYKRMVAAYVIGFSVTKEELATYPQMKFATGESDAGVIVSYNTEGPKNVEVNAKNVVVTTTTAPVTEGEDYFGPASFHEDDYKFFYNNLKENVAKRIATYKAK